MKKLFAVAFVLFSLQILAQERYTNPILSGFYPDPSVCRAGEDYYLVNSTFAYFPGIPVFHSKDLVHWKLIGHAIDRVGQMDFTGMGVSRAIFAPTIRFHDGLFYITCTLIDGKGNFVITAKNPAGPWSSPTWLPFNGIDPSLFWDDDGKAYITYNSIPPDDKSLYPGHRTIRLRSFDYKNLKVGEEETIIVNGGTDLAKKPSWIEGPHLLKKFGYYYLIAAEGGTGADHSVVAFRSKNINGPYRPYEKNPVLTQRHLSKERKNAVTSTGHADLVELPDGRWYAVFLGTRPYEADYFNTGRETFLTPVAWQNQWPLINPCFETVQPSYPLPFSNKNPGKQNYSGDVRYTDDFGEKEISKDWMFLRTVKSKWFFPNDKNDFLKLSVRPETVAGKMNPSYLGRRQQHARFTATTSMDFSTAAENEKAGLLCFMNEDHFYFLSKSEENGVPVIQLFRSMPAAADSNRMENVATEKIDGSVPLQLRVEANADQYVFSYSTDGKSWNMIGPVMDGKFLSTKIAGGFAANFVGCTVGLYTTSLGMVSQNSAWFDWFRYEGVDEFSK